MFFFFLLLGICQKCLFLDDILNDVFFPNMITRNLKHETNVLEKKKKTRLVWHPKEGKTKLCLPSSFFAVMKLPRST